VRHGGYLQRLYRDTRPAEHKIRNSLCFSYSNFLSSVTDKVRVTAEVAEVLTTNVVFLLPVHDIITVGRIPVRDAAIFL
jgi:hypothetical protein